MEVLTINSIQLWIVICEPLLYITKIILVQIMTRSDTFISGETITDFHQHDEQIYQVVWLQQQVKFQKVYGGNISHQDMRVGYIIITILLMGTGWLVLHHQMVYGDEHETHI